MKFIGRKMELEKLNAEYERDGGFVVIYHFALNARQVFFQRW